VGASHCETGILLKVARCFLERECLGGSLERVELGSGPERGVGRCEVESLHGERGLGAIRLDSAARKRTSAHTFGGEETTAAVGGLEERLGSFYKLGRTS
jgi:hypothetical protein